MKILSIDTASDVCGVSILEDDKLVCNLDVNTGHTHSENLMPQIASAVSNSKISISDIDLIVSDIGPGSFTGLRIGVATAKAFSDSLGIPCVGVSSLEVLAYKVLNSSSKTICSVIDCKNRNCYFAVYSLDNGKISCKIKPSATTIQEMIDLLQDDNIFFIGDGVITYKDILMENFPNGTFSNDNDLDSYSLGIAGRNKYLQFGAADILPLYLRKPQAERQKEGK